MDTANRFLKLLSITVDQQDILLFGFSMPTKQELRPWKTKKKLDKGRLNVTSAILTQADADAFEQQLVVVDPQSDNTLSLGNLILQAPKLVPRKSALCYGPDWNPPTPVTQLSCVHELWNVQKQELYRQLQNALGSEGRALYQDTRSLLGQLKSACGINFPEHGARLGNYEHYDELPLSCPLDVCHDKESEGRRILVNKPSEWTRPMLINCTAQHLDRVLFNKASFVSSTDTLIEFEADETIDQCSVQAWDQETGELIFHRAYFTVNDMALSLNVRGSDRLISDPWSEKLHSAARNRSDIIREKIETVNLYSSDEPIHIGRQDPIGAAAKVGNQLLSPYRFKPSKGAFIAKNQKDGEINSFLKIKEYIDRDDLSHVVIADPYFSVPTVAKMLTRIENTQLVVTVITSLVDTDPDANQERKGVAEEYRQFLQRNAQVVHQKLRVCNLYRGKDHVFHDRYLIRYHKNGNIDGFSLSNSLNSMGQFYPFVITPLEYEVCLEVAEYLDQLQDEEHQKTKPKKERVSCDVLYDYRDRCSDQDSQPHEQNDIEQIGSDWLARWPNMRIPADELPEALDCVLCHWEDSRDETCRMLSKLGCCTYPWAASELAALLLEKQDIVAGYIDWFSTKIHQTEETHSHRGIETALDEFTLWHLLTGKAKPDRIGFSILLRDPPHVHYRGEGWLIGGCDLLLALDSTRFTTLLEETCSPLMLSCLTMRLSFWSWSKSLYRCLLSSKNLCVQLLAIHWVGFLLNRDRCDDLTPETVLSLIASLEPNLRLLQLTRLLSEAAFHVRNPGRDPGCWSKMLPALIKCTAAVLPNCSIEGKEYGLHWLYDSDKYSLSALHLEIAIQMENGPIREELLDKAVAIMQEYLTHPYYDQDITHHIKLFIDAVEMRYGIQAEHEIHKRVVDWAVFEDAADPSLRNYDYERWSDACRRALGQIQLLQAFLELHPQAEKTQKCLRQWENQIRLST